MTSFEKRYCNRPFRLSVHALIRNQANEILILKRSLNSRINGGKWDLPGGKIEVGENFDEALIREVKEETGIIIDINGLLTAVESTTLTPDLIIIVLIMHGFLVSGEVQLSNEHDDFQWVTFNQFRNIDLCSQFRDLPISGLMN